MADIYINNCPHCCGSSKLALENNVYYIVCAKCGHKVKICDDKDITRGACEQVVLPGKETRAAVNNWNTKEEENG